MDKPTDFSIAPIDLTSFDRMSGSFLFSRGYRTRLMGASILGPGDEDGEEEGLGGGIAHTFNYYPRQACSEAKYSVDPAREEYLRNLCAPLASPVCSQWDQLFTKNAGWPGLSVQFRNRGKQFAVALVSEEKKRIDLVDCLGR